MNVLQSVLLPIGWLATGFALYYGDRFLDRHIEGSARKKAGSWPFWWVFVVAAALGWGVAMATVDDSPVPACAQVIVLVILLLASVIAFCARYGLRLRR